MNERIDYLVIDKACNGSYVFHNDKWHRLLEVTGRCFNYDKDILPYTGTLVIENSDFIYDQLIITKKTYSLDWINSLSVNRFECDW